MNIKENISKYDVKISYSEKDKDYIAKVTNVEKVSAVIGIGDTREEALKELYIALEGVLEAIIEKGWEIPQPEKSIIN